MPASISSPIRSGVDVAGPRVQTIFARGMSARSRPRSGMFQVLPKSMSLDMTGRMGFAWDLHGSRSWVAVAAAVVLGGCIVQQDQPDLVGQDIRLTIVHTSDIHSRLFPYNFVPNTFDQG